MQILPPNNLSGIIKHYLFLDSSGSDLKNLRLFSDGNTGIVFTTNNNLSLTFNKEKLPHSFLYGQITQFKDIQITHECSLIIVVFQPTGIKKLLGIDAADLRDHIISFEDVFGNEKNDLEEKLAGVSTIEEKLTILNSFFTSITLRNTKEKEKIVFASIDFILKNNGLISNRQLVKFSGYSERHIERLFMESVGINPKNFANIIKLHSFLKQLKKTTEKASLTELVYQSGYADQSHLIKEFKKITGMTPTAYKNNKNKLAINFLAMPAA